MSLSSVKRYARLADEGKPLAPKKTPGKRPKIDKDAERLLEPDLEERPAATLAHRREFPEVMVGTSVSEYTISRWVRRLGFARKRAAGASERDKFLRAA